MAIADYFFSESHSLKVLQKAVTICNIKGFRFQEACSKNQSFNEFWVYSFYNPKRQSI